MFNNISDILFLFRLTRLENAWQHTVIVWADRYTVGCGFMGFTISNGVYHRNYTSFCGPGGNIVGATAACIR